MRKFSLSWVYIESYFFLLGVSPKMHISWKQKEAQWLTIEVNNSWSNTLSIFILQLGRYSVDFSKKTSQYVHPIGEFHWYESKVSYEVILFKTKWIEYPLHRQTQWTDKWKKCQMLNTRHHACSLGKASWMTVWPGLLVHEAEIVHSKRTKKHWKLFAA